MSEIKKKGNIQSFFSDFWKFAARGNVFDLAIAVVLGNAFTGIVNALVSDVITPLLSLATSHVNLNTYTYTLRGPQIFNGAETTPVVIGYGHLLQVTMNFLVVGLVIFVMFRVIQALRKKIARAEHDHPEEKEEAPPQERLLAEIRDLLKERAGR